MQVCRDRNGRGCGQVLPLDRFYTSRGRTVKVCKDCYRDIYSRPRSARRADGAANNRAFGIELELTGPSYSVIANALTAAGINVNYIGRYRASNGNTAWELKRDCSVRGEGLELVSPKLRGAAGLREVEKVCTALNSVGATVDRSCGMHVHHDARGLTASQVRDFVLSFVDHEELVMNMMAPSRRTNHYTPRWTGSYAVSQLRNATQLSQLSGLGPRGTINLHAFSRHGSVELRCHAGTANFKKIAAWVRFGQALMKAALAGATVSTDSTSAMLADLVAHGLTTEDAATLLRFETQGETRAAVAARVASLRAEIAAAESVLEEV